MTSFVPKQSLYKLYYAFVFPYINYGVEVYANSTKLAIDKLNKVNNKLLRILLNTNMALIMFELYRIFNVLPIPLLHEMKLLELIINFIIIIIYYRKFFKNILLQINPSISIQRVVRIICTSLWIIRALVNVVVYTEVVNIGMSFLTI